MGRPARLAKEELRDALLEMIESPGPYLLDVQVPYQEHVHADDPLRDDGEGFDQEVRLGLARSIRGENARRVPNAVAA